MEARFSPSERQQLLAFARQVIERTLCDAEPPAIPKIPALAENGACFVTIKDFRGELRGCIGNLEAFEPLGENILRNAVNAAISDPRFPPLEPEELQESVLELSILTPARPISSVAEFEVGRDGIILRAAGRGAVFLPQVAPEQGWDAETTLGYLARKAGLSPSAWRSPETKLFTFQAEVFGEEAN